MNPTKRELHLINYDCGSSFCLDKFNPITNVQFIKPDGGLWASPIECEFGWREWCEAEDFLDKEFCGTMESFTFRYIGNVLRIDTYEDLLKMAWLEPAFIIKYPDYERMLSNGIDAIWLTDKGEHKTRHSHPLHLYGWDCESVLIMNPTGIVVEPKKLAGCNNG